MAEQRNAELIAEARERVTFGSDLDPMDADRIITELSDALEAAEQRADELAAKVRAETLRKAREAINTVRNVPSLIALADKFGGYHQGERAGLEMAEGVIDRIEREAGE